MSQNYKRLVALAALLFAAALPAGAGRCKNPKGIPWETKIVYLKFEGCAAAEPEKPFDLNVGDKPVRFSKDAASGYWRGKTEAQFPIGSAAHMLTVDLTIPARVACTAISEEYEEGNCVALFRIACEDVWLLRVEPVPPGAPAKISYERDPVPAVYAACDVDLPAPEDAVEIELRRNEQVRVKVENLPNGPVTVPVSLKMFGRKTTMNLRHVAPRAVAENAAVTTNASMRALKKGQLQHVLEDLLFTRK